MRMYKFLLESALRLRKVLTRDLVMNIGEFDWFAIVEMVNKGYSQQYLKVKDYEFKVSVCEKDNPEDDYIKRMKWELDKEKTRLKIYEIARKNLNRELGYWENDLGWVNDGSPEARNLYNGTYGMHM